MKKSSIVLAAAVVILSACAENDTFKSAANEQQKADQALSFSAYADKVTRGTNSTALQDFYTVFGVYGWKTVAKTDGNGTEELDVFNNVPNEYFATDAKGNVVYDGDDEKPSKEWVLGDNFQGAWYYKDVRYWDKMATSYQFFAIAPYESTPTYSVNPGDANIAIATTSSRYDITTEKNLAMVATTENGPVVPQTALTYSGFNKDYMIADKKVATPKGTVTTTDVQLIFHHILTKLNVKVKKSTSYIGTQLLKVNQLTIANLDEKGNFVYNTNMTKNGWSTEGSRDFTIATPYALANGATADPAMTDYPDNYWIETLIFPQKTNCKAEGAQPTPVELTDMYLYIQYQIGAEIFNAYYDMAYIFDPTTAPQPARLYTDQDPEVVNGEKTTSDTKPAVPGGDFEFEQGSQYNLVITVGPEPIHFDASVIQWDTEVDPTSLTVN